MQKPFSASSSTESTITCSEPNLVTINLTLKAYDNLLAETLKLHPDCIKLMALEGVSTINAINLYISLGTDEMGTFKSGRDAVACIGVTPIQPGLFNAKITV